MIISCAFDEWKGVAVMLTNTNTTAATLRPRSGSPFLQPATFMAITPSVGADVRVADTATKKDRPPRGVPR